MSGIMVISSISPVHSVFWLVVTFINSAALFILLGLDFIALMMIIVYVGAIAILFIFVIMMLNLAEGGGESDMINYAPIGFGLGTFFLGALVSGGGGIYGTLLGGGEWNLTRPWALQKSHNIEAIGRILYSDCYYLFILVSFILLVAMIGAIVLTQEIDV